MCVVLVREHAPTHRDDLLVELMAGVPNLRKLKLPTSFKLIVAFYLKKQKLL